ncbi:unnamed protein product [Rotaria magnacalcarata]|uniref:Uncharacterized protein n=1 Tax=Rotaria magnacalcarata TaxID=392030 RepID=A0A816KN24_9BILA|nr:unnamed protein product [Rotaria magnacalcarata]CAF1253528.1 unnamed protein product [Rotaria magnacalcarata]CAF1923141.1 unnamed protein product [Rotaria magnacalcarata]CAF4125972.1 unnamed protein product [Rotaria magnacalcarata]CAF4143028.1 unnamed protein product [Rotaria magnacalcarata]
MQHMEFDGSLNPSNRSKRAVSITVSAISILLGLSCLAGFVIASVKLDLSTDLLNQCKTDTEPIALCYIRSIINNNFSTEWNRYIIISLLLTYASVFCHTITETSRVDLSGLLGQMIIQTICFIIGIGPYFSILFIPSYMRFYTLKKKLNKSPVSIELLYVGLIYVIVAIIVPTYIIYFFSSKTRLVSIMSIILLVSPLGFPLVSIPFRFCSEFNQRCWCIELRRLITCCQLVIVILTVPLYFTVVVSMILHWSSDMIKRSYVPESSNMPNPLAIIWSIDYVSLLIGLILFLITNEHLFPSNRNAIRPSKIQMLIVNFIFGLFFIISPCLAFPIYIAWKAYQPVDEE